MRFSLLLSLLATACFGQTVYKNAGTKLGTAVFVDCSADAGVNCTRTPATGTVNVRCSTGSATELGCVSTSAQSFSGTKTFTAARAETFGGADGGVYVKTSDGVSLTGWGSFNTYSAQNDWGVRDSVGRWVGAFGGTYYDYARGGPAAIQLTGFHSVAVVIGTTDGGVSADGGVKSYTATLFVVPADGGTPRSLCYFEDGCEYGGGSFPAMGSDVACGQDGGGFMRRNETLFVVTTDTECMLNPGLNFSVDYTGVP